MGIVKEEEIVMVTNLELSDMKNNVGYALPSQSSYCDFKLVTKKGNKFEIENLWKDSPGIFSNQQMPNHDESYLKVVVTEESIQAKNKGKVKDLLTVIKTSDELYKDALDEEKGEVNGFSIQNITGESIV